MRKAEDIKNVKNNIRGIRHGGTNRNRLYLP